MIDAMLSSLYRFRFLLMLIRAITMPRQLFAFDSRFFFSLLFC